MITWSARIVCHHPGCPLCTILRLVNLLNIDQTRCLLLEVGKNIGEDLPAHHLGLTNRRKGSNCFEEVVIGVSRVSGGEERVEVLLREDSLEVLDIVRIVDISR